MAHHDAEGQERPIAFGSRRLSPQEQNYSPLDKEALALMHGTERFHQYLWGRPFETVTDDKPLLGLVAPDKRIPFKAPPRIVNWALKLATYAYKLVYKPGKELDHADALSTLPLSEVLVVVPRPADVFMLHVALPDVLSAGAVP